MKYSIDYEEDKKGFEILKDIEKAIEEEKEEFRYGNSTYEEMLYKIGEKLYIAGEALYRENRYADKIDSGEDERFVDDERLDDEVREYVNY